MKKYTRKQIINKELYVKCSGSEECNKALMYMFNDEGRRLTIEDKYIFDDVIYLVFKTYLERDRNCHRMIPYCSLPKGCIGIEFSQINFDAKVELDENSIEKYNILNRLIITNKI